MKTLSRSQQILLASSAVLTTFTAFAAFISIIHLTLR